MKILFLGYSDILKRKIIPGIENLKNIECEIASNKKVYDSIFVKVYKDYFKAINNTKSNVVYISLINSLHFKTCKYALNKKKHVIVDKPLTLNSKDYNYLINLSKKNKLLLIEATVFHFSKRFSNFYKRINFDKKILINIRFSIPKLNKDNFRNKLEYGGGCYNDMSSYAIKCIDLFCKQKNYLINYSQLKKRNLITEFKIKISYENFKMKCIFQFENKYKNYINVINGSSKISYPMAFSQQIENSQFFLINKKIFNFNPENTFGNFLKQMLKIIKKKKLQYILQRTY